MKIHRPLLAAGLPLCLALAAGCGGDHEKKVASQVAVKVNSDEITVHQVNAVLARAQDITVEDPALAKREVVEKLIGQELARQQAVVKKLDRSPEVVQAIEAARAEILARAYLQQVGAAQAGPTPEEVGRYYTEHPELFAARRLYALEEASFPPRADLVAELRARVAGANSLQEIVDWLSSQQVRVSLSRGTRAAEQIPLDMLPVLKQMNDGEMRVLERGGRSHVVRLVASKPAPMQEETARPRIEKFLANRRAGELMLAELKRLRRQARIEYVGEFAGETEPNRATAMAEKENDSAKNLERAVRALR
jgi:EpsD family peptidyl-prolyl cis-trans isomerase